MRPDWDTYFLSICEAVAKRADCSRRQVGAVITKDNRIVSTGYNGAPAGSPGCLSDACPRARGETSISGDYDLCIAVHAEANALLYADYERCKGATMYCTDQPCSGCGKLLRAAGIARLVVCPETQETQEQSMAVDPRSTTACQLDMSNDGVGPPFGFRIRHYG